MDSKDDEQARGITMKSSSISLLYVPGAATCTEGPNSVPRADRLEQGAALGGWTCWQGVAAVGLQLPAGLQPSSPAVAVCIRRGP